MNCKQNAKFGGGGGAYKCVREDLVESGCKLKHDGENSKLL
jgi:hypothetical protein